MRELKFRAWDTYKNKMIYVGNEMIFSYHSHCDHPIMQFTGLLDKNRKLIYEGDIVLFADWEPKPIEWRDGRYWVGNSLVILCEMESIYMEVIGNIYETPNKE